VAVKMGLARQIFTALALLISIRQVAN
jgi:hypothetical protein